MTKRAARLSISEEEIDYLFKLLTDRFEVDKEYETQRMNLDIRERLLRLKRK